MYRLIVRPNLWVLSIFVVVWLFISQCFGQEVKCDYDRDNPSLDNAKKYYQALNYKCAEQELNEFLMRDSIPLQARADAHIWLGMAYYRLLERESERRLAALSRFIEALEQYPGYRGPFEKDSTSEIARIFNEAEDTMQTRESYRMELEAKQCKENWVRYGDARRRNSRLKIGTGIVIVGAAVGAFIFDGKANDAYESYKAAVAPNDIEIAWDDYDSRKKTRNIMIGVAGAAGLLEILWFLKQPNKPEDDCSKLNRVIGVEKIDIRVSPIGVHLTVLIPGL